MERKYQPMAGLSRRKDPELELAIKANRSGPKRKRSPKQWEPDASLDPGTSYNDLGLGPKLADPGAEPTWRFTVYRLNRQVRTGVSTCTTYADAHDAATDILGEYLDLSSVPREGRAVYSCQVVGLQGQDDGTALGKDWA